MASRILTLMALLVLGFAWCRAQPADPVPPASEPKGASLGVQIGPVPDILYHHLSNLPRGQGVVVTRVFAGPSTTKALLQRYDILLRYDGKPIIDCDHLHQLLRSDRPDRKVTLQLLRGGREMTTEAVLLPASTAPLVQARPRIGTKLVESPARVPKPESFARVSVAVTPLKDGQMEVTIEYSDKGERQKRQYTGKVEDIEQEVQKLPPRVQGLARTALSQIPGFSSKKDTLARPFSDRSNR